jgi:hypothetical protein
MLPRRWIVECIFVSVVIAAGVGLRLRYLDAGSFWVDEAESSINALTILQAGYPVDRYLGLPIFENTLIKPWPESPEYEFKDLSYSDRGLAIYHGWFPLYSIAASFRLNGVRPPTARIGEPLRPDVNEWKRQTRAARIPALVYGGIFLAICYIAGTVVYGTDAGVTALLAACILTRHIDASIQARYYSALITVSTLAVLMMWLMLTNGKLRSYVGGGFAFLLLFYTHLVTFAAACAALALLVPWLVRRPRSVRNLIVFSLIVLGGAVPWIVGTGFVTQLGSIPPARSYLSFPADLLRYPVGRPPHLLLFAFFALLVLSAFSSRVKLPSRMRTPLLQAGKPVLFLSVCIVTAYAVFMLFIPVASLDTGRMKSCYWGSALLLGSIYCAALGRMLSPRYSLVAAPGIAFLAALISGTSLGGPSIRFPEWGGLVALTEDLGHSYLTADTKLYAAPNSHLILSFYTGLAFQSMAPIRKSFLDRYQGDVIFVDSTDFRSEGSDLAPLKLKQAAGEAGEDLTANQAQALSRELETLDYRRSMQARISGRRCLSAPVPSYAGPLLEEARASRNRTMAAMDEGWPIIRGFMTKDWFDWSGVFFYRFVDPESRLGPNLNYAGRLRGSRADVLTKSGWVVYRSSAHRSLTQGVDFRLLP